MHTRDIGRITEVLVKYGYSLFCTGGDSTRRLITSHNNGSHQSSTLQLSSGCSCKVGGRIRVTQALIDSNVSCLSSWLRFSMYGTPTAKDTIECSIEPLKN